MDKNDIRQAGLKVTKPRTRILSLLEETEQQHYSAEEIYQTLLAEGTKIGLATVYRVLTQFETAGMVIRHNFDSDQCVFELDRGDHHDHMVDLKTGQIVEFTDEVIEIRQREIAKQHGFVISGHSLTLYGEFGKEVKDK